MMQAKKIVGLYKKGQIQINDSVFIGANTTILPDVKIGENCIIGTGSIVTHDILENSVAMGVPARVICSTDEFIQKNMQRMMNTKIFDSSYRMCRKLSDSKKDELKEATSLGIAFME